MYFWNIESLKRDLVFDGLGDRESFLYVLWLGLVTAALYAIPFGEQNVWDHIDSAVGIVAIGVGTYWVYRCNGGAEGSEFLARWVSLSWVFGIRFTVVAIVVAVALVAGIELLFPGTIREESTPVESVGVALVEIVYYWRLGHHVSAVSSVSRAA